MMQEYMNIYNNNLEDIEKFISSTITNIGSLKKKEQTSFNKLFEVFPSLELVYTCDEDTLIQNSNNIYRDKTTKSQFGADRSYLLSKIEYKLNDVTITKPYISSASGDTCITASKKEGDKIFFMDFDITKLLQRLGLIEIQKEFNIVNKAFYFLAAMVMMLLALFTVGYSINEIVHGIFVKNIISIETIFKPIIAITLGLAIFDLGKTILEQEVIFKSYSKNSKNEYKVLTKFSITIIIALLIESLMVVFKIAMEDYSQMLNAVYLIFGVSILILVLGLFIKLTRENS